MIRIPTHPWSLSTDELEGSLGVDQAKGLSEDEATKRLKQFGENIFDTDNRPSLVAIFARQFKNPLVAVLLLATALTVGL